MSPRSHPPQMTDRHVVVLGALCSMSCAQCWACTNVVAEFVLLMCRIKDSSSSRTASAGKRRRDLDRARRPSRPLPARPGAASVSDRRHEEEPPARPRDPRSARTVTPVHLRRRLRPVASPDRTDKELRYMRDLRAADVPADRRRLRLASLGRGHLRVPPAQVVGLCGGGPRRRSTQRPRPRDRAGREPAPARLEGWPPASPSSSSTRLTQGHLPGGGPRCSGGG